jgi:hypothetical protein
LFALAQAIANDYEGFEKRTAVGYAENPAEPTVRPQQ